jgi:histidinol-phosphate aminotransferase
MVLKANKHILKISPYAGGKPIEEVKREFHLRSVIKLASNEMPYPPSPGVIRAVRSSVRSANRYPDGNCFALRAELARRLKVAPRQLVFGCGSDELIVLALRAFINEGDEVIMAKPSFLVYSIASTAAGAKLVEVPLKGLVYDLAGMKRAVNKKTRIVFIGNPDNPSGQFIPKSAMQEFLAGLPGDVLVFVDEAYFEFIDDPGYPDMLSVLRSRGNVIVSRTFSKYYALAGLRIGYAVASPWVADLMNRAREPFNVTSVAQAAALAALRDGAYYKKILQRINRERGVLAAGLGKMGLVFSPGVTNFIQVRVPGGSGRVVLALMKRGVIVRDMASWGLKDYIRVTIGTPAENRRFLKTLKEVL